MAGVSTPELAARVAEAGALGSVALGALTPEAAARCIEAVRALTDRPINYNVFTHAPAVADAGRARAWLQALGPAFRACGADAPEALSLPYASFVEDDALLDVLAFHRAEIVSFHFGCPRPDQVERLKRGGAVLMGCATAPAEARALEAAGMDLVVLQGIEAGGHRGCFEPARDDELPLGDLLDLTIDSVSVPVIAAGGLATGADIATVLARGASAAQLGTAFVPCPESSASARHRALLGRAGVATDFTANISGRPARGVRNAWHALEAPAPGLPDYPIAYAAGKALAAAADGAGSDRFDVVWAGTGLERVRALPAAELVATLAAELRAAQSS